MGNDFILCVRGVRDSTPDFAMTLFLPYMQQSTHQQSIPHALSSPPTATLWTSSPADCLMVSMIEVRSVCTMFVRRMWDPFEIPSQSKSHRIRKRSHQRATFYLVRYIRFLLVGPEYRDVFSRRYISYGPFLPPATCLPSVSNLAFPSFSWILSAPSFS